MADRMGSPLTAPRLNRRWRTSLPDNAVAVAWSPDARRLAVALASGPVQVLDADSGKIVHDLKGHGFGAASLSWKPDGSRLASAGQDGKARLWDAASGAEVAALDAGAAWADQVTWHPTVDVLATAAGKRLRLWSGSGQLIRDYPPHPSTISALAWRPGSGELTSACYGGVRVWMPDTDEPTARIDWTGSVLCVAWRPGGKALAHGDQGGTAHLWTPADGNHLEMAGYPLKVRHVSWEPSGRWLATDGSDLVMVWDCKPPGPDGTEPLQLKGHKGPLTALAFAPGAPLLATGGEDGKIHLWQPGTFRKPVATSDAGGAVALVAWAARSRLLAVANEVAGVAVYSV